MARRRKFSNNLAERISAVESQSWENTGQIIRRLGIEVNWAKIANVMISGESVESSNFITGVSGWQIDGNGNAEFNNITARGTIFATAGEIGGLDIVNTLTLQTGGVFRTATSGQRVEIAEADFDRISFYSGDAFEDIRAFIQVTPTGTGSTKTLNLLIGGVSTTGDSGALGITIASETVDDSTTPPKIIFSYSGGSVQTPVFQLQNNINMWILGTGRIMMANLGSAANPTIGIGSGYNDGIYSPVDGTLAFATNGIFSGKVMSTGDWYFGDGSTGRAQIADIGSAAAPTYTFQGDTNTGMYRTAADSLGFTRAGVLTMFLRSDGVVFGSSWTTGFPMIVPGAGTVSAPSYTWAGDPDTGVYRYSANQIGFSVGGLLRFSVGGTHIYGRRATGHIAIKNDATPSAALPTYAFYGDTDTGMYLYGTNSIGFSLGGVSRWRMAMSGDQSRLYASETNDYLGMNSVSEQWVMVINDVEELTLGQTGFKVQNVYDSTSAGAANVYVDSGGRLWRSTSTEDIKIDVKPWTSDGSVLDLTPSTFYPLAGNTVKGEKLKRQGRRKQLGLIHEDVKTHFPKAATVDKGIDWNAIVTAMLGELIEFKNEVQELKNEIKELREARV